MPTDFHNGYHSELALDNHIIDSHLMRFYLRHISNTGQEICAALGVKVRTKTVQRGYRFRLTDISPEQMEALPQYLGNERFLWNKLLHEQRERMKRDELACRTSI